MQTHSIRFCICMQTHSIRFCILMQTRSIRFCSDTQHPLLHLHAEPVHAQGFTEPVHA
jgi:hypothetical protein